MRIGLMGFGALGSAVFAHAQAPGLGCTISGVLVRSPGRALPAGLAVATRLDSFLALGHDVVIECAGHQALREFGVAVIDNGRDLVPAAIGALVDDSLRAALLEAAARTGRNVRIPSGAMVGIDGLAAARHAGIDDVLYRGTMAPSALHANEPAPARKTVVFDGFAREACSRYPKNANLTAAIALAGIGFDRTRVELSVDPVIVHNLHELHVRGAFGAFETRVSGRRITSTSSSSKIVAGSLLQAALGSGFNLLSKV